VARYAPLSIDATVLGRTSNGNIVVRYGGVTGFNNNPGAGFLDRN
jgi:hypothetical protein